MSCTAIILARQGSKGLPGKNTAMLAGRPCIEWTIDHACRSTRVHRVVVSSDCRVALDIASRAGVETHDRPADLASDIATIDDAARAAVRDARVDPHDPILILYANVPVRPDALLDDAAALLIESGCDSVQSAARVGKHHPWWTWRVDQDSAAVSPWEGDTLNHGVHRRQDLPPAFVPDGGVIALTQDALHLRRIGGDNGPHAFLGTDRRAIVTNEGEVIDIDSRIDQIVAETVLLERSRARASA